MQKTTTISTNFSPISIGSMQKAILELNAWSKINRMKKSGIKPILYLKKGYRRPSWLIDICNNEKIKTKRSNYVTGEKGWLVDGEMYRFYFKRDLTNITSNTYAETN